MNESQLTEILACLPADRTQFSYFKDQYAVYLLKLYLSTSERKDIYSLKQSRVKKLLDKPLINQTLKNAGNGILEITELDNIWSPNTEQYVLTLGRWGHKKGNNWNQTSRPGINLVLQLNLNNYYEERFNSIAGCTLNRMTPSCHPKSVKRSATLAWARLDMDFNSGELLIEEIQSDLIRDLEYTYERATKRTGEDLYMYWSRGKLNRKKMVAYCQEVISTQKKIWSEAMMAATLWFAHQELGFRKVYYHTFNTGKVMKRIAGSPPPRSLYTDLPERFCFQTTTKAPDFIAQNTKAKRRLKASTNPEWFLLER